MHPENFSMFNGAQVRDLLEAQKRDIQKAIDQSLDEEIFHRDEEDLVDEIFQDYVYECPVINFDGMYVTSSEQAVPSEHSPPDIFTLLGKSYPVHVICYHLPFMGDAELFHYTPSQYSLWFPEVFVEDQEVCFEIIDFRKDMEIVRKEAERIIDSIKKFSDALTKDVAVYGIQDSYIASLVQERKQRLLHNRNRLTLLGVPVKGVPGIIKPSTKGTSEYKEERSVVTSTTQFDKPVKVFYSYSHKDRRYREKLETQLALLQREGLISAWHDHKIEAGREWADQIDNHLNAAQIILLLVSPDFLGSDYCYNKELKRAMEKHDLGEAIVIPVILRSCEWYQSPLGKLQALPRGGNPVISRRWRNSDEAFLDVVQGIRKAVEELNKRPKPDLQIKDLRTLSSTTALEVHGVSNVPDAFIRRQKDALTALELGAIVVLARKSEAGEEFHLIKKQETLRALNTAQAGEQSSPNIGIVKSSIVNKYECDGYIIYAAIFNDIVPDDYMVYKGQIDDLRVRSRRRGASVSPNSVYIVDFD